MDFTFESPRQFEGSRGDRSRSDGPTSSSINFPVIIFYDSLSPAQLPAARSISLSTLILQGFWHKNLPPTRPEEAVGSPRYDYRTSGIVEIALIPLYVDVSADHGSS